MGSVRNLFFVFIAALLGVVLTIGCKTSTCDCNDEPEHWIEIFVYPKEFGNLNKLIYEDYSRGVKNADLYFKIKADYVQRVADYPLNEWGIKNGDTFLYTRFYNGIELKSFQITSDSFALNRTYSNFEIKGTTARSRTCKCFTATSKTCKQNDSTLNIYNGLIIKK